MTQRGVGYAVKRGEQYVEENNHRLRETRPKSEKDDQAIGSAGKNICLVFGWRQDGAQPSFTVIENTDVGFSWILGSG